MRQNLIKMKNNELWILGHKLISHQSSGDYDLAVLETAPNVPGPPPHHHESYKELFMVTEGSMTFMVNGEKRVLKAGESIDIPPNTVHTFFNDGPQVCKYINIHSPKGFSSFFMDLGVPTSEDKAQEKSVAQEKIERVIATAADYDMIISGPPE